MDVAIIGSGHVGLVTGACFADLGNRVVCVDKDKEKIDSLTNGKIPFYEPGLEEIVERNLQEGRITFTNNMEKAVNESLIVFIAVGTPSKINGEANLVYVEDVASQIAKIISDYKLIVEKSTVPVHTGNWVKHTISLNLNKDIEFDVASNPEFLSEGNAINDFMKPDRIVLGVETERAEQYLRELYKPLKASIIVTDINSAELIKHASNSFLATKISFINAVSEVCEKTGADINEVAKGMGLDFRIGKKFLKAGIGYGGSCFPKDVDAFIHIADNKDCDFSILKAVREINTRQLNNFIRKVKESLWVIQGKNIGVWGLSFKPGTDDIRNAPALEIIESLLREEANIKVYDPEVIKSVKKMRVLENVKFCDNAYEVVTDVDCLLILTEWNEFKAIDLKKVKALLKQPLIIDGRNLYELDKMEELGFKYISIGRPSTKGEQVKNKGYINEKRY